MKRLGVLLILCLVLLAAAVPWMLRPARIADTDIEPGVSRGMDPPTSFLSVTPVSARVDTPPATSADARPRKQPAPARSDFERMAADVTAKGAGVSAANGAAAKGTSPSPKSWGGRVGNRPTRSVPAKLTPELIDQALRVAHDIDAAIATRFRDLRAKNPVELERRLRRATRIWDLVKLKQEEPHLYQLKLVELRVDAEVSRLAAELRKARGEQRESDADALEQQLRMQMRLKLVFEFKAREDYLCRLQDIVGRLEKELEAERQSLKKNFDDVVDKRIAEMLARPHAHQHAKPTVAKRADPKTTKRRIDDPAE